MSVWITGARGFIGRHLARECATRGASVAGVGHGAWPDALRWGVSDWLNGEVSGSNLDDLYARTGRPDSLFHLAGGSSVGTSFANPFEDYERTVATTARLLDWVRSRSPTTRVVVVSSAAVYGAGHVESITENAALAPYSPYGAHKFAMEILCRSFAANYGLELAVIRVFSAYGPELRKQILWDICNRALSDTPQLVLQGTGDELRDWIEIGDVVRLLVMARDWCSPRCQIVNGGTGAGLRVRDAAALLLDSLKIDKPLAFSGTKRAGDPERLVADVRLAKQEGFIASVMPEAGFPAYAAWFRSQYRP